MTLRIFEEAHENEAVVALHGWFSAAEVAVVEDTAAAQGGPLTIDLTHLTGMDPEGIRSLLRLRERRGAPPRRQSLLRSAAREWASRTGEMSHWAE